MSQNLIFEKVGIVVDGVSKATRTLETHFGDEGYSTANGLPDSFDVSVIVPMYNVSEWLLPCLESIAAQTKDKVQAILVNDGSTDDTLSIAQGFVDSQADNPRVSFELHDKTNGGLGHARNYGLKFARGTYILFVDSDDLIASHMIQMLYDVIRRDGSDMAICNTVRVTSQLVKRSVPHRRAFRSIPLVTHITKSPTLVSDATAWNKLIRRDFWEGNAFFWPEAMLYEDIPVTLPLHYLANQISVINEPLYLWRLRDGETRSITQQAESPQHLVDRLHTNRMLNRFFEKHVTEESLFDAHICKQLTRDMPMFLANVESRTPEDARAYMAELVEYFGPFATEERLAKITPISALKLRCAMNGDLEGFMRALNYGRTGYLTASIAKDELGYGMAVDPEVFGCERVNALTEKLDDAPVRCVSGFAKFENGFEIDGYQYYGRVSFELGDQQYAAFLVEEVQGVEVPVYSTARSVPGLTKRIGATVNEQMGETTRYSYDGAGFKVLVDLDDPRVSALAPGRYAVKVNYYNQLERGFFYLVNAGTAAKGQVADMVVERNGKRYTLELALQDFVVMKVEEL